MKANMRRATITARYATWCGNCETRIAPGDEIRVEIDQSVHDVCPTTPCTYSAERLPCVRCHLTSCDCELT